MKPLGFMIKSQEALITKQHQNKVTYYGLA